MSEHSTLLPPNRSPLERNLEAATARLGDVPTPIRDVWNPATAPAALLPWLAWGLSIDLWDTAWSEAQKRAAIASAIEDQRKKGTPASLRAVLDRYDPLIGVTEWFEDPDGNLAPYTFRLELPLNADTEVRLDEVSVAALVRDIAAVKPLRAHFDAVHKLDAQAGAYLLSPLMLAGFARLDATADTDAALDPVWATYLETEDGEPIRGGEGDFLEVA